MWFGWVFSLFVIPRTASITVASFGLSSQIHVMTPGFELRLGLNTPNWLRTDSPQKTPLTGSTSLFTPVTVPFCLWYEKKGDVVCRWRYGCSGTFRFIWLPFLILGTSGYFRRLSYPWYVPFLQFPRSTGVWFSRRSSSVIPWRRRSDGPLLITGSRFDIVSP